MSVQELINAVPGMMNSLMGGPPSNPKYVTKHDAAMLLKELAQEAGSTITYLELRQMQMKADIAAMRGVLDACKGAVQAHLDMVNVMARVGAVPIPTILERSQHNCPIILSQIDAIMAETDYPVEYGNGR